jgi:hypothetical protein
MVRAIPSVLAFAAAVNGAVLTGVTCESRVDINSPAITVVVNTNYCSIQPDNALITKRSALAHSEGSWALNEDTFTLELLASAVGDEVVFLPYLSIFGTGTARSGFTGALYTTEPAILSLGLSGGLTMAEEELHLPLSRSAASMGTAHGFSAIYLAWGSCGAEWISQ